MEEFRVPFLLGRVVYPSREEIDRLVREYGDAAEFLANVALDYKLVVSSGNDIEAVILLVEFGGPTTWWILDERNCSFFDELVELVKPSWWPATVRSR